MLRLIPGATDHFDGQLGDKNDISDGIRGGCLNNAYHSSFGRVSSVLSPLAFPDVRQSPKSKIVVLGFSDLASKVVHSACLGVEEEKFAAVLRI